MWFNSIATGNLFGISNINNVKTNKQSYGVNFGQTLTQDTFQNNSPAKLFNELAIRKMIADNPEITQILKQNKLSTNLNMKELQDLKNGHCQETQNISMAILKHLPKIVSQNIDVATLKDGAMLHDFGKVLIPSEVLNKNSKLTEQEHKIMDLHSEFGYQLLKTTGVKEEVLDLVRNHHNTLNNTDNSKPYVQNPALQIINVADKYSALTEKRTYKEAFSQEKALAILTQEAEDGKIPPIVLNALKEAVECGDIA